MRIRVHLTEHVRIEVGDTVVDEASLPGHQGRMALAYLLVEHHRPVPRDELADLLWGGEPPGSWENGLAVVVSKLRAVLAKAGLNEGSLTHAFGCYQLHLPPVAWIDVEAAGETAALAEQALAQHDAARAQKSASVAAAIARRMFVPGAEGVWVESKRAELVVVLRRALDCMSAAALLLDDPTGAAAAASEAIALEPYREQAYLQLIEVQAASGNRAEALQTYERCRRLLVEELGVSPSPQTEAAYLALLDTHTGPTTTEHRRPDRASSIADQVIRHAKRGDCSVAYDVFGVDSPDLLAFSTGMLPIESMNDEPALALFDHRLASFRRLIRFDLRGIGRSDAVTPSNPPTLEQWMHDALAVMDDAGSLRAALFAPQDAALQAILLAATHPDRVSSLVVVNGTARIPEAQGYPGHPQLVLDEFLDVNFEADAVERGYDALEFFAPTMAGDETFRGWWNRAGNQGAAPDVAKLIDRARFQADVRELLPLIRVPTLILHRRDSAPSPVAHGRYLAAHIPGAEYVELPGADDLYWVGDTKRMLNEIEEFLTGVRQGPNTERIEAAVAFIDLVGADEHLADMSERRRRDLLDSYHDAATRQLQRFRGHEIKTFGDGVLATFDGPPRPVFCVQAIRCAQAIREAALDLGLDTRAGVHLGEIAVRGENPNGTTCQIATQVAAFAEPRRVLVSRTVIDFVVGSGLELVDRGEHVLDGALGNWRLFAVKP